MRKVKLYTLNSQDVMVSGDYTSMCATYERPVHVRHSNEFIINHPIEVKQVPVELHVRQSTYGKEEYLVAFDPKIRDLLDSDREKIRQELEQTKVLYKDCLLLNKSLQKSNKTLSKEHSGMMCLKRINENEIKRLTDNFEMFYNMSFWKRLVYLFVGKIKGD